MILLYLAAHIFNSPKLFLFGIKVINVTKLTVMSINLFNCGKATIIIYMYIKVFKLI